MRAKFLYHSLDFSQECGKNEQRKSIFKDDSLSWATLDAKKLVHLSITQFNRTAITNRVVKTNCATSTGGWGHTR